MLKVFNYNATDFSGGCLAVLDKATNVAVTENLQQPHTIAFEYPADEKAQYLKENNIVAVEGQAYRLKSVTEDNNNRLTIYRAEGERLFFSDAQRKHITNIPDMIGVNPYDVIITAFASTQFHLMTNEELEPLGMKRIGSNGVLIDFFSMDKCNPYTVCEAVIEAYGKGEIYVDNYRFAIVERIGKDNGVRLSLDKNLETLSIQKQTTELATRLYPYGKNDLTIRSLDDIKDDAGNIIHQKGSPYIDSPNQSKYGIIEGYKDYSEYEKADKIFEHGAWDLMGLSPVGAVNEYRLDTPQLTISGDMIDLAKLAEYGDIEKVSMGDTVHVFDNDGVEYVKRVINITYYPYSSTPPRVTIGSPSNTNLFYAQWQQAKLFKTLMKNSTGGTAKIIASYFNGNTSQSPIKSADNKLSLDNALISINDGSAIRLRIGIVNNKFVFEIYDAAGNRLLSADESDGKGFMNASSLLVGGADVTEKLKELQEEIDKLKETET